VKARGQDIEKFCLAKTRYATRPLAQDAILGILRTKRRKQHRNFHSYHCPNCHGYHITSKAS